VSSLEASSTTKGEDKNDVQIEGVSKDRKFSPDSEDLHAHLNTVETPFNKLSEKELCPGAGALEKINAALR
jgi:hypothetical protein